MNTSDWLEEDYHGHHPTKLVRRHDPHSAQQPPTGSHNTELRRLANKAMQEMHPNMANWFHLKAVCYTLCNDDPPKKSILVMNQRTGHYLTLSTMIVDTGSMFFVMNKKHKKALASTTLTLARPLLTPALAARRHSAAAPAVGPGGANARGDAWREPPTSWCWQTSRASVRHQL
ncbi:hypothetical protein CYMTET_20683 [Cymbomonas tetramitiformis]|uniref:Uncharacterized protein n=1 Tax=Cymbomonas tetramitiformis TaxID=36881 RepID=A0AAE0G3T6_9CHLO|nr:hypothetical protein CYMTET_20683 [Cymbomonas tetramitiformis]